MCQQRTAYLKETARKGTEEKCDDHRADNFLFVIYSELERKEYEAKSHSVSY